MFDSHCHLNFGIFEETYKDVIEKARRVGVTHMVIPGTDFPTSQKAIDIAIDFVNVFAAVGIHPTKDLESMDLRKTMAKLAELASNEKVKAIGEIGLDYYRYRSPASVQKKFFLEQLRLAVKTDKSVIIHNRHAAEDVVRLVSANWQDAFEQKMVFHCCEPVEEMLSFAIKHRVFVGVDGDVTFDKAKQDFVKKVPLELLVIETDSPFITPEPLRSKKVFISEPYGTMNRKPNEPSNVRFIAEKLVKIKNLHLNEVIEKTTKNAITLFDL